MHVVVHVTVVIGDVVLPTLQERPALVVVPLDCRLIGLKSALKYLIINKNLII
jgi:hypothetical protein